jgi:stage V sporulation protein SpoVS
MKSLLNGILCASLLLVAVGCGKDSKSGGSSHGLIGYNQYNQSSQQTIQSLNQWFQSNQEGRGLGTLKIDLKQRSQNSNQNCDTIDLKIFSVPYCWSTSTSNSNSDTVISSRTITIVNDGRKISEKGNAELNAIFSGAAGQVVQAIQVSNTATRIDILNNNQITSYIIDRTYHSLLNPVQKSTVSSTQYVYATCAYMGTCSL